ncbi:MAG: hypothetical protein Q8P26_02280 [Candidatus Levybacteria bacterium]|nr:hypothetical protein [Candidatus Levybacteria bacterium]
MFQIVYKLIAVLFLLILADLVYAGVSIGFGNKAYDIGLEPFGKTSSECDVGEKSLKAEKIKSLVQQEFGIIVVDPDLISKVNVYADVQKSFQIDTSMWDTRTLTYLFKALCSLPSSMYLSKVPEKTFYIDFGADLKIREYVLYGIPQNLTGLVYGFSNDIVFTLSRQQIEKTVELLKNGWRDVVTRTVRQISPTQFILVSNSWEVNGREVGGQYWGAYGSQQDAILLAKNSQGEYEYIMRIVHELSHKAHAIKGEEMDIQLIDLLKLNNKQEFTEKKFITKGFSKTTVSFLRGVFNISKRQKSLTRGILMESAIRSHLEYGNTNLNEFTSVGSEFYIYGKSNFLSIYSPFIGKSKAEKFYNFLKENVFENKEY